LAEHPDGIWRGHWVEHERMGIELTIHRAQAIIDHVQFTGLPRVGAEIGVFRGESSRLLLSGMPDLSLYMVDAWKAPKVAERYWQDPHMRQLSQSTMDEALLLAVGATDFAHTRRMVLIADQVRAARAVDDKSLSFVFIDSDHSGAGVREAVETWWPKLKVGGCMLGHDFDHPDFPEVRPTVMALGSALGCAVGVLSDRVWFFSPKP
jgi:predicted O-methyltransferase YrrM